MVSPFLLSQILAAGAFAFGLASFQFKDKRKIFLSFVVSGVFNSAHFFVLGRPEPGALMLVIAIRYGVAVFTSDRRAMYLFIAISIGVFLATYESALAIVALIASVLGAVASFQSSDRLVRLIIMAGTTAWVIHNTLVGSPVGALMEVAFLSSNLLGYWRYYHRPRELAQRDCHGGGPPAAIP